MSAAAVAQVHQPTAQAIWLVIAAAGSTALLAGLIIWLLVRTGRSGGSDDDDGGGGGGGTGRRPPRGPQPGGADWWPEFERQFAAYVAHRSAIGRRHDRTTSRFAGGDRETSDFDVVERG